jgi:hypothetical protein
MTRKEQIMDAAMYYAKKNENTPIPYLDFVEAAEWADRTMLFRISEYLRGKLPAKEIDKLCKIMEE